MAAPDHDQEFVDALEGCGLTNVQIENVIDQGVDSLDELKNLSEDEIKSMCTNIRKMPPPEAPAAGRGARRAGVVPITTSNERNLKLLRFYLLHLDRTQRDFDIDNFGDETLENAKVQREIETNKKGDPPKIPDKMKSVAQIRVTIDDLDDYLKRALGMSGAPLAYVTRDEVEPLEGIYENKLDEDEIIERAPHTPPYFA